MKRNPFFLFLAIVIILSMTLTACESSTETKPTPVFEFKQFNPTKAPVHPTVPSTVTSNPNNTVETEATKVPD